MSAQQLSQSEIWDDSALVASWNEALDEYKKYHSIAARGERVEDVVAAEEGIDIPASEESSSREPGAGLPAWEPKDTDIKDANHLESTAEITSHKEFTPKTEQQPQQVPAEPSTAPLPIASSMPHAILHTVQDESLKNLMMSWYYAGYYTGLHEGQTKSQAHQSSYHEGTGN